MIQSCSKRILLLKIRLVVYKIKKGNCMITMKKLLFTLFLMLFGVTLLSATGEKVDVPDAVRSPVLYYGGDIITMEGDKPQYVESVVTQEGKIVFVGKLPEAKKKFKDATQKDLKGKTLLPGFVDAHAHFYAFGVQAIGANLLAPPDGGVKNIDDVVSTLKEWAKGDDLKRTGWIYGMGYDDAMLAEGRHPTKEDLDKVSKDIPVMVIHISGHFLCVKQCWIEKSRYYRSE